MLMIRNSSLVHHELKIFFPSYCYFSHWEEQFDHYTKREMEGKKKIVVKDDLYENKNRKKLLCKIIQLL